MTGYIDTNNLCEDGTPPHKIEMRLLEGKSPEPFDLNEYHNMKVERLFVLLRDNKEIASLPASLVSENEIKYLLQAAWPKGNK